MRRVRAGQTFPLRCPWAWRREGGGGGGGTWGWQGYKVSEVSQSGPKNTKTHRVRKQHKQEDAMFLAKQKGMKGG